MAPPVEACTYRLYPVALERGHIWRRKPKANLDTDPMEGLCMPNILLFRLSLTHKQEPNNTMLTKTQREYHRYIKTFADVSLKSIPIENNLENHLHGDTGLVGIVEAAILIQLVRRAVKHIRRRF
jgi:hypothetical protein